MSQDNEQPNQLKDRLFSRQLWLRIVYMIIFYIVSRVIAWMIGLCAILQTISRLFTGNLMTPVWDFSANLNAYMMQLIEYLTYRSEEKPFPFMDWPNQDSDIEVELKEEEKE